MITDLWALVSRTDFVEWRRRTVDAASLLKSNPTENADRAVKKILDTLDPVLTQSRRQMPRSKFEQLTKEVQNLCDKAFRLSLEMRSSKAIFRVIIPEPKTEIVAEDTENEMVAVEGKNVPPSGLFRVSFTVFGGLEKTTLIPGDNEETIKLEKSQVVGFAS